MPSFTYLYKADLYPSCFQTPSRFVVFRKTRDGNVSRTNSHHGLLCPFKSPNRAMNVDVIIIRWYGHICAIYVNHQLSVQSTIQVKKKTLHIRALYWLFVIFCTMVKTLHTQCIFQLEFQAKCPLKPLNSWVGLFQFTALLHFILISS